MRIIRLYGTLLSLSLRRQLSFRADLVFEVVGTLVSLAASLGALLAVFTRTEQLGGYTAAQAVILLGTFQIVSGLRQALVEPNLRFNGAQIADGRFDGILIQPAPTIFLASLGSAAPLALAQSVLGCVLVATLIIGTGVSVTVFGLIGWLLMLAAATAVMWATRCLIASTVFWSLGFSLDVAYDAAWQLGGYPTSMLRQPLRTLGYIVPVAFLATVPTGILTGQLSALWAVLGVAVGAASVLVAITVWRLGLRRYTSATS